MVFASRVAVRLGMMKEEDLMRVEELLRTFGLPVKPKLGHDTDTILAAMKHDKKSTDGKLRFILPAGIGNVVIGDDIPHDILLTELEEMLQ